MGCQAHPPAHWVQGGTRLDLPRARWSRGDVVIDLMPDGRVFGNGEHLFTIDAGGRVFDLENEPIALLEGDGQVVGNNDASLGRVGLRNASPPGVEAAWLTIEETGAVVRFDPEGGPLHDGFWAGCGAALRTCTLATHVLALGQMRGGPHSNVSVGVGVGVGSASGTAAGFGMHMAP